MKKIVIFLLLVISLLVVTIGTSCNKKNKQESVSSSTSDSSSESKTETSEFEGLVSVNTGFEEDDSKYVFSSGNGTDLSVNTDKNRVFTGEKSLKVHVSQFAVAQFKFSDYIAEKIIMDYNSLSFWVYSEYDGHLAISNTALNGTVKVYIDETIEKGVWTKITILKGSDLFNIIQYNLSFNSFTLNVMGNDYGKVVEYDLYIDDVRLYKDGMAGECTLTLSDGNGGNLTEMPTVLVGSEYVLPKINVYSPEGYAIYNADSLVEKSVYAQDGTKISINDGKIAVDEVGVYYYDCLYTRDGILNRLACEFEVVFADFKLPAMGVANLNELYKIPSANVYKFGTEELLDDVTIKTQVKDLSGNVVSNTDEFTPNKVGEYIVTYTISRSINGTENVKVLEKSLWATQTSGLVADFSAGEEKMFAPYGSVMTGKATNEIYKISANGNTDSFKVVVNGDRALTLSLTEQFPYANAKDGKYLSMWIYNDGNLDLRVELSSSSDTCELKAKAWNFVIFRSENTDDLLNSEILVYDAKTQKRITCNFYIDDVRFIRENDDEEVLFTDKITTTDYNEQTGEGRKYAINFEYELDLTLLTIDGERFSENATVVSVKDKRNRKVNVRDGKYFTPTVVGNYTITLSYTNGNVISSIEKQISVTEQMLLSPDETFRLKPAEQNVLYEFTNLPVLWNYGVIDNSIKPQVIIYDSNDNEVPVENYSFIPTKVGKYKVFFLAKDTTNASSNALLEVSLTVYQQGKYGVVADFEDGNEKVLESTTYYYGEVSEFSIATNIVHSGNNSAMFSNTHSDTREMKFGLSSDNIAGDISGTEYFSFWIYIEDATGDNTYAINKSSYANWVNERDKSFVVGSLNFYVQANRWVEVRISKEDYEEILGGTIFAGQTISAGGSMWTAENNDFITQFYVHNMQQSLPKGLKVYIDDITLGY